MPWETINQNSEITAIHAALLPTEPDGVVVYFGDWAAVDDIGVQEVTHTRLYRMAPGLANPIVTPPGNLPDTDAFCCGQAFLADGRLLAAGGTFGWAGTHEGGIHLEHYDGERACWIYLPREQSWVQVKALNFQPGSNSKGGGRWYPTLVTLPNGEVFAAGGHPAGDDHYPEDWPKFDARHNNNTPERYVPGADKWILMTEDLTAPNGFAFETDSYPRFHLLPGGLLFSDTAGLDKRGTEGDEVTNDLRIFDPYAGEWVGPAIADLTVLPTFYKRGSEATSVLLPLMPPHYRARILACNSGDVTAFRIDVDDTPRWRQTSDRQGDMQGRRRDNACATLLPNGQVLVTGGWPGNYQADDPSRAEVIPELYTPGIDWDAGDFSGEEGWETLDEEPAPSRRGYHSVALLLPDGSVWHGGSTTIDVDSDMDGLVGDGANRDIELYRPSYMSDAGRPTITSCPSHIGYNMSFKVGTPQAEDIARAVLIRNGSITHGFNTDQRFVVLEIVNVDGSELSVVSPPHGGIAPPGYYMLFLIDSEDRICQRASFIRVSRQKLVVSADISTYSIHEVVALGDNALFPNALYIAADGFLPSEVTTPTYKLLLPNNDPVPDVTVTVGGPKYEAGADQSDVAQRIVYPVNIRFDSTEAFDTFPEDQDFQTVIFYGQMGPYVNFVNLQLSRNPNPRMRDGDPPWLSIDLRVFKTNPGDMPTAGVEHPSADQGEAGAYGYIQDVVQAYNEWDGGAHPFDDLPTDQEVNRLELGSLDVNGDPVFNYAVAKVRFRAPEDIDAADVRVFFRMWTTGWNALEFDEGGTYRRSGNGPSATPLLGLTDGEVTNVPCFAEGRAADMTQQSDTTNRRTLEGVGAAEVQGYFGCWLDINQTTPRFPLEPSDDGPFGGGDSPLSIQELMRGLHQCLVAEIHYQPDPVQPGATPGSSDNLAQRNILLDFSDNPGGFAAHLVHHTFELEASPVSFEQSVLATPLGQTTATTARHHPDELAIDWGDLPRDSMVTLFMPQVDAEPIVQAAAARQRPATLSAAGPGTVRFKVSDVGFLPIPGPLAKSIAGLISVQLPPGVPYGSTYKVVMRQISGRCYKVLGTTEFRIQVRTAEELLPQFLHNLAVLKHIALAIPGTNRWHPIFERYLAELGDRIRAFGGDPDSVEPSPTGHPPKPKPDDRTDVAAFAGKVHRLHYDCFGTFESFELRDCDTRKRFASCDRDVERVLLTACRDDLRVTVVYDPKSGGLKRITLDCCA